MDKVIKTTPPGKFIKLKKPAEKRMTSSAGKHTFLHLKPNKNDGLDSARVQEIVKIPFSRPEAYYLQQIMAKIT